MHTKTFYYPILIKEVYLDSFGHMNNATYLILFEEARWDLITKNGYGLKKIIETQQGPTILEITITYKKEITLRDEIMIETMLVSYSKKIGKLRQRMLRGEEECCVAEFTMGFFDLKTRRLIEPTPEWLKAMGVD